MGVGHEGRHQRGLDPWPPLPQLRPQCLRPERGARRVHVLHAVARARARHRRGVGAVPQSRLHVRAHPRPSSTRAVGDEARDDHVSRDGVHRVQPGAVGVHQVQRGLRGRRRRAPRPRRTRDGSDGARGAGEERRGGVLRGARGGGHALQRPHGARAQGPARQAGGRALRRRRGGRRRDGVEGSRRHARLRRAVVAYRHLVHGAVRDDVHPSHPRSHRARRRQSNVQR